LLQGTAFLKSAWVGVSAIGCSILKMEIKVEGGSASYQIPLLQGQNFMKGGFKLNDL
jgi:hypothetical protein